MLEIDGITKAGFSECTGLNAENNVFEYREGNDPITPRKLPGLNKFGNITLKSGVTNSKELFDWHKNVQDGDIKRANMSIVLLDEKRQEQVRWNVSNAWPSKYTGPDLKSAANEVAIEALEIVHEGVERQ
jgi:phage tail-like protein